MLASNAGAPHPHGVAPSPFLLPGGWHIVAGAVLWIGGCLFLATRANIPNAFTEWR